MEMLLDISGFAVKVVILFLAFSGAAILIAALIRRDGPDYGDLEITHLNKRQDSLAQGLRRATQDKDAKKEKEKKSAEKKEKRVYVLDFHGDIAASEVTELREQVTTLLAVAKPSDEVVVVLESGGGIMQNYGLAASQLTRLRDADIPLTVCIDKMAASGGYMIACPADKILAAPFATVGSIGVIVMFPNFHRLLKKFNVDYMELTAGEFKRTLSHLGEITDKGKEKFLEELDTAHSLFKNFIAQYRPNVNLEKVATGEHWTGMEALDLNLVDEVITSDDYLMKCSVEAEVYRVSYHGPKSVRERFAGMLTEATDRLLLRWWSRLENETHLRT